MNRLIIAASLLTLATSSALATGSHSGGHEKKMAVGQPGDAAAATRTIEITMMEKDDGSMVFEPVMLNIKKGETVRFQLTNKGETDHEFVMDDHKSNQKHKKAMEKYPDMEHADANAIRLESGKSGEIVWTFSNSGKFEFACLIPGHYEAGMRGDLTVDAKSASN